MFSSPEARREDCYNQGFEHPCNRIMGAFLQCGMQQFLVGVGRLVYRTFFHTTGVCILYSLEFAKEVINFILVENLKQVFLCDFVRTKL